MGFALAATVVMALLTTLTARSWDLAMVSGRVSPAELVTALAATAATILAGWLVLGIVLGTVSALPGRLGSLAAHASTRLTPMLARRLAVWLLTASTGTLALPSTAAASRMPLVAVSVTAGHPVGTPPNPHTAPGVMFGEPSPAEASATPQRAPDPGLLPSRPGVRPSPSPTLGPTRRPPTPAPTTESPAISRSLTTPADDGDVVVHRGDTLWGIAAARLGPDATEVEIAAAWPQWYAANRDTIGEDPDLILPGQILHPPQAATP
ncbi:MAG: LysM peptidoglycan-binding domain-containing protein [Nostocoides sp.]